MSLSPVAFIAPNYRDFKGDWIKFYEPATTTPKTIYLDANKSASAAKLEISQDGFIVSASSAIVMPYIEGAYDAYIFPTETDADNNDTSSAVRVADNLLLGTIQDLEISESVADMKSTDFAIGDSVMCKRYYAGGELVEGLIYEIQANTAVDGYIDHDLSNGNVAILVVSESLSVSKAGAVADWNGSTGTDSSPMINACLTKCANTFRLSRVTMPSGRFRINSTLSVPTGTSLEGSGMSFGVQRYTELNYTGADSTKAISFSSFYGSLKDFGLLNSSGFSNQSGVYIEAGTTRTSFEFISVVGFGAGIRNPHDATTFTHLFRGVYVKFCSIGLFLKKVNNVVLDACFIESNGTNVDFEEGANFVMCNGCVIELFGDGRTGEEDDSVSIKVNNLVNFVCRDSYFEINSFEARQQVLATFQATQGLVFEGNYIAKNAALTPTLIQFLDNNSRAVSIKHNKVLRGSVGDLLVGGTASNLNSFEVGNNVLPANFEEVDCSFTPEIYIAGQSPTDPLAYSVQEGTIKVSGGVAVVNAYVAITGTSSDAGAISIKLPDSVKARRGFTSNNEVQCFVAAGNFTSPFVNFLGIIESGGNEILIRRDFATAVQSSNLTTTSFVRVNASFAIDTPIIA